MRAVWMVLAVALLPAAMAGEPAPQLELLATLKGTRPKEWALAPIAFSPDGKLLAVGDSREARLEGEAEDHPLVQLWDVGRRKRIGTLRGHTDAVVGVVFSRDGKTLVSFANGGEIKLWDVAKWREKPQPKLDPGWSFLALGPDGKTLAFAKDDNHRVILWDVAAGKEKVLPGGEKVSLKGYSSLPGSVAISPDGALWAAAGGRFGSEGLPGSGEVKVWDVATGRERASLKGHLKLKVSLRQLSYLHKAEGVPKRVLVKVAALNGMEFASEEDVDEQITRALEKVLNREQREKYLKVLLRNIGTTSHEGPEVVRCVAFSPDGKTLASASVYGTVVLWDVKSGKRKATLQRFDPEGKREPNPAFSVAFSPDGKTLAAGTLLGIRLWDVESGKNLVVLSDPPGTVWSVAFSPDSKTVATAGSKGIIGPRTQSPIDPAVRLWEWIPPRKADR